MSGAPSDSYAGGLFHTKSAANLSRRFKRRKQRNVRDVKFGAGVYRRKPKKLSRCDQVAEHLSEGLTLPEIATRMGVTLKAVENHFTAIRKRLGPQAV